MRYARRWQAPLRPPHRQQRKSLETGAAVPGSAGGSRLALSRLPEATVDLAPPPFNRVSPGLRKFSAISRRSNPSDGHPTTSDLATNASDGVQRTWLPGGIWDVKE